MKRLPAFLASFALAGLFAAGSAFARGLNLMDLIADEEGRDLVPAPAETGSVVVVERPVTNVVEKIVERPVTNVIEKIVEKPVVTVVTNVVEKVVEKPVTNVAETVVEVSGTEPPRKPAGARKARITAETTYYDRKNGFVYFDRNVSVDDEQYQLHADKAFVFFGATNNLKRIVAIGHVALTNEARRAYGTKASYYRDNGLVVLHGGDGVAAEVRDVSKAEDQVVRGSKIKFWIDSEQVEVLNADISAPVGGKGGLGPDGLKSMLSK